VRVDHGKVLVLLWQPGTFYGPWGTVKVVALDATTGAADWTFSATDSVVSTMDTAVERGRVVVTYLCCARPGHPEGVWTTAFLNENDGSLPVGGVSNNELLTTAAEGFLYGQQVDTTFGSVSIVAIDQATGSTWTQPFGGTAAVSSTSAIFTSPSGLRAFDPRTGAAQWTSSPLTGRFSEPVIAGGVAYLVTVDSTSAKLHTFDAATGAEVNSLTIPGPDPFGARAPVVANGRVYVNETGSITAYAP
jgi:outer membrane protein assembly factor BamB